MLSGQFDKDLGVFTAGCHRAVIGDGQTSGAGSHAPSNRTEAPTTSASDVSRYSGTTPSAATRRHACGPPASSSIRLPS